MKKILVFGATGDTGRYFIDYFLENYSGNDYEIIASGTRHTDCFDKKGVKYYPVDITKKEDFNTLPTVIYAIVDFAGLMPARMRGYDPQRYIDVNITGTLNILEFARENKVDRMLYMQSFGDIKDYGESKLLLTADMPRNFSFKTDHSIYVMTKNFAVDMMENYYEMYGLKPFVFRLPTIYLWSDIDDYYVDGEKRKIGYRLLIDKAIKGEDIEVWGDASRVKEMVYVKDFCQMLYKALFVDRQKGYYNVGTGIGTSLLDQIKGIVEVFGDDNHKSQIKLNPNMPNAPQYIMDITPAIYELGYKPKYDYISMLKDMKAESKNRKCDIDE